MICPHCKCEYIRGVRECADCGVALVDALDAPAPALLDAGEVASLWQGNDPGERSAVKETLEKAGIAVIDQEAAGYFIFPSMRPKTEIFVSRKNLEQATKVLVDAGVLNDPSELTEEELNSLALPESEIADDDGQEFSQPDLSGDWHEDDPAAEVWNGDTEEFADTLVACLREIGIASRKGSDAGHWRLEVRPEQEARAREIIREVEQASPPE